MILFIAFPIHNVCALVPVVELNAIVFPVDTLIKPVLPIVPNPPTKEMVYV